MPKSKKRAKKTEEEKVVKSSNPMKTWWGKTIILTLAFGFVGLILVQLIYSIVQIMNK